MPNPLDVATGSVQFVTLAGRQYPVKLRIKDWGELQAWLRSTAESPIKATARAILEMDQSGQRLPDHIQRGMYAAAAEEVRKWPPKAGSFAWLQLLDNTEGGNARFLMTALKVGGTDVTLDEAAAIEDRLLPGEMTDLVGACLFGVIPAPKSGAATEAPATPAPTTNGDGSSSGSPTSAPGGRSATSGS